MNTATCMDFGRKIFETDWYRQIEFVSISFSKERQSFRITLSLRFCFMGDCLAGFFSQFRFSPKVFGKEMQEILYIYKTFW